MSKLQELIQELCPNGVEYKQLGDKTVSTMQRGTSLTKKDSMEGVYPVISGGRIPAFYCDRFNRDGETITIAGSGAGAGFVQYWNEKIFVCDAFSVKGVNDVSTKYLYYCLTNLQDKIYATKKGGGVPHVHISSIDKFLIPIPPLAVQEEIVKILDRFAEYAAELQARQEQYEYYLNQLLSNNITEIPLGDIGDIRMCKRILKEQTSDLGEIPFYKIGTFGKQPDAYISRKLFDEYKLRYSYPKMGNILISASGTIGRTIIFDGKDAYFQDSNIVWIENDENKVLNKYLFYCYQIARWKISEGGTIQRLYNDNLKQTLIPIPSSTNIERSLSEQHRIVSILEQFDTLVTSISEGLPKEIKLRKKQYEYYRNKLLSFPNNKVSA